MFWSLCTSCIYIWTTSASGYKLYKFLSERVPYLAETFLNIYVKDSLFVTESVCVVFHWKHRLKVKLLLAKLQDVILKGQLLGMRKFLVTKSLLKIIKDAFSAAATRSVLSKRFHKNFAKFTEKHLCHSLFNKVAGLQLY